MSSLLTTLGIDRLSVDDRLQLLGEIWDSLPDDADSLPPTGAQMRELDRRIARIDADPSAVVPWEEVEARLMTRRRP